MIQKQAWERQEWEGAASFRNFEKYYLTQPHPRSLPKAYHNYLMTEKGRDEKDAKSRHVPGTWLQWSRGQNYKNETVGATWKERAELYDTHVFEIRKQVENEYKSVLTTRELKDYEKELDIWDNLADGLEAKIDADMKKAEDNFAVFDPRPFIRPMSELVKLRDDITKLGRRALNMPMEIREDRLANAKENEPFEMIWSEPFDEEDGGKIVEQFRTTIHKTDKNTAT